MKKLFLATFMMAGLCTAVQAQQAKNAPSVHQEQKAADVKTFKAKSDAFLTALNKNNTNEAFSLMSQVQQMFMQRNIDLAKKNPKSEAIQKRQILGQQLKDYSQDMAKNKSQITQIVYEMQASY